MHTYEMKMSEFEALYLITNDLLSATAVEMFVSPSQDRDRVRMSEAAACPPAHVPRLPIP
jgi:hypothetical protein